MFRTRKYQIYPNEEQQKEMKQLFGAVRYVYNWGLSVCKLRYKSSFKLNTPHFTLNKLLTPHKKQKGNEWLGDATNEPQQQTLKDLRKAFTNFFEGRANYPKPKKKGGKQSARFQRDIHHKIGFIKLPNLDWIPTDKNYKNQEINGVIKFATISKDRTGKYFCSITYDNLIKDPTPPKVREITKITGIDLGCTDYAVLNDGTKLVFSKELKAELKKVNKQLITEHRKLSRKKKGSNRKRRQRIKLSKKYKRIHNLIDNFLHHTTNTLVNSESQAFAIEDLVVKKMISKDKKKKKKKRRNNGLAKSIQEKSFGKFRTLLTYKAERKGKYVIVCGKYFPSTKNCSNCGAKNKDVVLGVSEWECPKCNHKHDRDHNAAKNLAKEAKEKIADGKFVNEQSTKAIIRLC